MSRCHYHSRCTPGSGEVVVAKGIVGSSVLRFTIRLDRGCLRGRVISAVLRFT